MPKRPEYPESDSARYELLSARMAVDKLSASIDIATHRFRGGNYAPKEVVAAYFGIDLSTLDGYIAEQGSELAKSGYEVLRGEALARYMPTAGEEIAKAPPSQLCVFERKAIVNLGLLIREGKVAARFRESIPEILSRRTAPRVKPESKPSPHLGNPDAAMRRAISIRQPYVELILQGKKTEEYRSMPTNIRERVYLYASRRPAEDEEEGWGEAGFEVGELPTGLIVGTVEIVDCHWDDELDCFAYSLERPLRLEGFLKAINQPQPRFWLPRFT